METDIHHLHTNTPPSHSGSLSASCSNWPGSGPYTHGSLSNQGPLLTLHSSILFFLSPSLGFLFYCFLFELFLRDSLSSFVWFLSYFGSGSSGEKHHTPPPSPLLCSQPCNSHWFPPCPHCLSLCFSQRGLREAAPLSSLPFILFFPSHSVSLCLPLPPASVSLSEPVGSQTKRVSRGLERNHLSAPPPSRSLTHSPSLSLSPTPPLPSSALHLLLLHHHQNKSFSHFSHDFCLPSMFLSSSVFSTVCTDTYCNCTYDLHCLHYIHT